jgi:hypothetical protein
MRTTTLGWPTTTPAHGDELEEMITAIFDGTQEADMTTLLGVTAA